MKNLHFLLVLFVFVSCRNVSTNHTTIDRKSVIPTKNNTTIVKPALTSNAEYIDFDEVRINGKLPIITKAKLLYNVLGKPDSIVTPNMDDVCVSYYDKPFKEAYIKNSAFEIYGDNTVVSTLDFKSNHALEFTTQNFRLDHNTTLRELQKIFPNAVKSKYELNVVKLGKTVTVNLPISKRTSNYSWLLFFKNEKLVRIDLYTPC